MNHPPYTGVVPAPGCPHYITIRDAELGKVECPWCEARPVASHRRRKGGKHRQAARAAECDAGLMILDGGDAA